MDHHDIREGNYIFRCYTEHLDHKATGYRDPQIQDLSLKYYNLIVESCLFWVCVVWLTWLWFVLATCKRITYISFRASAGGYMSHDNTMCINTARSWTRVHTFLANTRPITHTFGVYGAFRLAIRWSSNVGSQTWTGWNSIWVSTFRVWSAWGWIARIFNFVMNYRRWSYSKICVMFELVRLE